MCSIYYQKLEYIKLGENGNMKANRKFVEGEEAVSAVIGVILMVAITVAIAATVYVYVSGMLDTGATKAPDIAFQFDDTDAGANVGTLRVISVSANNVLWSDVEVGGTATTTARSAGNVAAGHTINVTATGSVTASYKGLTLYGTWTFT